METSGDRLHLAAIPYPGRGHINPMLNLCRLLSSKPILITFVVTDEWLRILSSAPAPALPPNVRLRTIPDVLPSEAMRGAYFTGFISAVLNEMGKPVEELLAGIEPAPDAVVADSLLPWVATIAAKMNLPAFALFTQSASLLLGIHVLDQLDAAGDRAEESEFLEYVPAISLNQVFSIQLWRRKFTETISWSLNAQGLLLTSIYELEPRAVDVLRSKLQLPVYCLGNVNPFRELNTSSSSYLTWLDSQPRSSVLYVSLGSYVPVASEQMQEMAHGLRASGVRFLWAARAEHENVRELSRELGMVVRWCDQLRVLCHPSVGGFLTHCGWNSCLEATYASLPMLTFPLTWDQIPNSKLIVDVWKVGLRLKEEGKELEMVRRERIEELVMKLMDFENEEIKELRRRTAELKGKIDKAFEYSGSACSCFDAFVHDVFKRATDCA